MSEKNGIQYLPLIRAMVKLSLALADADTVSEGIYCKFKFKKQLLMWISKTERATKPFMGHFVETSKEALYEGYETFRAFADDIHVKNEDRTALILLYCKAKSALNDLESLGFEEGGMIAHILIKHTGNMLKCIESQYGDIFKVKDSDGNTIQCIIDGYDNLGKKMFVND